MTIPRLENAAVGSPITRLGVSFFPVYLQGNSLPSIDTGSSSGLIVSEFEVATVGALKVTNPTGKPILIVEGEHFTGGKQNRTINATVLVPAGSSLEIPVSCLEQGRWGRHRAWHRAEAFAPERIRKRKRASVNRSFSVNRNRMSDQHRIWDDISTMMLREGVASPTNAADELENPTDGITSAGTLSMPSSNAARFRDSAAWSWRTAGMSQPWISSVRRTFSASTGERWCGRTSSKAHRPQAARQPPLPSGKSGGWEHHRLKLRPVSDSAVNTG